MKKIILYAIVIFIITGVAAITLFFYQQQTQLLLTEREKQGSVQTVEQFCKKLSISLNGEFKVNKSYPLLAGYKGPPWINISYLEHEVVKASFKIIGKEVISFDNLGDLGDCIIKGAGRNLESIDQKEAFIITRDYLGKLGMLKRLELKTVKYINNRYHISWESKNCRIAVELRGIDGKLMHYGKWVYRWIDERYRGSTLSTKIIKQENRP